VSAKAHPPFSTGFSWFGSNNQNLSFALESINTRTTVNRDWWVMDLDQRQRSGKGRVTKWQEDKRRKTKEEKWKGRGSRQRW
jgi:hypothetical protein